jgi:hypothetical protein
MNTKDTKDTKTFSVRLPLPIGTNDAGQEGEEFSFVFFVFFVFFVSLTVPFAYGIRTTTSFDAVPRPHTSAGRTRR